MLGRTQESKNAHEQGARNDIEFMNNAYDYMEQYFNGNGGSTSTYKGKLTEEEREAIKDNGLAEIQGDEITNENLKDNDNIKGVITGEVPIPTGFSYKEGTKDTGVVITDGESEFVWVPVPNIEEMAVLQEGSTENYQGVLYDFSGTTATKRGTVLIGSSTGYREPDVANAESYDANIDNLEIINNILGTSYSTAEQFKIILQQDYNLMVKSVEKYKGFFAGRFETSLNETKIAKSKVGVLPATSIEESGNTWYGLYAYQRKMAGVNGYTSVESHMIWGSNYDAMLRWALNGADAGKITTTGNAIHGITELYETGKISIPEKLDRINNIYDLEGNAKEWTAETVDRSYRTIRAGSFYQDVSADVREYHNSLAKGEDRSSRLILYIK